MARGPNAIWQPSGMCRLDQLRLGDPLVIRSLAGVEVEVEELRVDWVVRVELFKRDRPRLERFTEALAARHAFVAFVEDGAVLATALVRGRVTRSTLTLQRAYTRDQALDVQARLDSLVEGPT